MFVLFEKGGRGCHPGAERHGMRGGLGHHARHWSGRGERGARGEGRSRRMFDGGELRLVLLKLIADEPRHGYDLIREIESLTGGAYAPSPGVVYPTLTLLDDMGLIDAAAERGRQEGVRDHRRRHAPQLDANAELVDALIARLTALGERARRRPTRRRSAARWAICARC